MQGGVEGGGGLFFMIKQKIIETKRDYNLSNNMMINCEQELQFKYAWPTQLGTRAGRAPPPPPPILPDHAGSIPDESLLVPTNETVNTRKVA